MTDPTPPIIGRSLARGLGWRVAEYVCLCGPEDRPFEEHHDGFSIAAVLEGTFTYRGESGRALLHPGAFLLGNHGACFACGHDHSRGDRCIAFHFESETFGELAFGAGATSQFRFPTAMLPASAQSLVWIGQLDAATQKGAEPLDAGLVFDIASRIIAATSGSAAIPVDVSAMDERRISAALRHVEAHADVDVDIDQLAAAAATSKYHFLRTFRRIVGTTPHQYLIGIRLRRAAVQLSTGTASIASIAMAAGFGDLSTFNARFRRQFGMTPSIYRRREGRYAARS